MRRCLPALLAALLIGSVNLSAQDLMEVRRIELDSLVRFLRREFQPDIYFVKDEAEQSTFSVSAPRAQFLEAAFDALREKGYVVSSYGTARFILHSKSVFTSLPAGYFDDGRTSARDTTLQQYLAEQSAVVTFQNKVYEIGESNAGRRGKVFVSGHVRDVSSGEPLAGVSVYDDKTGAYTVTDGNGFYRVALPVGDNLLNLSGYSLDDMHLTLKVWDDGVLDVVMKEKVLALTGAVVSADAVSHHRDAKIGIERVRMEVINKIPSAFGEGDIIKAVLTLPGVKSVGEASSGFNVRGGSTDQNLILFNDGTIYNPTHLFGIFSAFNPDIVSEVELYKSSIPAEFGGRISSVLDVRSREGNANKVVGSLGLGLLTSRLHLEGPLVKGRTTFILGGRTTYSNWLLRKLPESSEYAGGLANFHDINAGLTHKIDEANTLQGHFYWSRDGFTFARDPAFRYSNLNASAKWRSRLSGRLNLTATAGFDQYGARLENSLGANQLSGYSVDTRIRQGFAKLHFRYGVNDAHSLTLGAHATYYHLQPGAMAPLYGGESLVKSWHIAPQDALEPALFASDEWTVSPELTLEGGLRLSGLLALHPAKFYANPELRLSGKYSFRDNLSLKAGFNTMSQYIHLISNTSSVSPIDTWQLTTDRIRPQTGWQAASGLYWTVAEGVLDLTLEAYYKRTAHQLDYKSGATTLMNPDLADDLVETYGKAWGVELMAKKSSGKLTGWVSYTYARSRLREMHDRGVATINGGAWYNAPHDKPHEVKLVGNFKFTHRYSLSANLDYATGRPVTLPIGVYDYGGGPRLAYTQRNTHRIPDYFRLDLALNIDPGHYLRQFSHMSVTLGVYNVTARKNAYSVFFDGNESYLLSVFAYPIPYLNLNLKF
ncbi:MAG: carboxypeptidase-like regulatory domain-containing protein [Bacteroidales bacterium]|nr:carboxypeptidase-like regulatory domain-containing protein [Bacteroidales bacterium]MBR6881585.1 carboxypeptidase-like regulatory domain-containing protein [Bacteroidales bacterium]